MNDQPASTVPDAATHPRVQGRCPACNSTSLFLGAGGYVTCCRLDCPDPTAVDDLLHRGRAAAVGQQILPPGQWLLEGTRDLSIPWETPRFTARPVTPEMERAATERAVQAAADSERSAAWFKATGGVIGAPAVNNGEERPRTIADNPATSSDSGPSVAECRRDDLRWPLESEGE